MVSELRVVGHSNDWTKAYEIESIQFPANFIGGINQSGTWLAVVHDSRLSTRHSPLSTLSTDDCRLSLIAARNRPQSAWRAQTQSF